MMMMMMMMIIIIIIITINFSSTNALKQSITKTDLNQFLVFNV